MIIEPEPVEQRALRYLSTHDTYAPDRSPSVNHAPIAIARVRFQQSRAGETDCRGL